MLFVLPTTSAIRPTSYHTPQPYQSHPNLGYYRYSEEPQFAVPSYPASRSPFFYQPSAEELEEVEYRRALEVVANHRRRQAAEEAAIRRQQHAEAARRQYFAMLAAELEQQRQEELLAARRAETIRSQVRARLVAAERQHPLGALCHCRQLGGARPVRRLYSHCRPVSNQSLRQVTRQPHAAKRRSLDDALKQRLAAESDPDITEPIRNLLSYLEPRPAQSEKPEDPREDAAKLIEDILSSIFPGLVTNAQPQPTPPSETAQGSVSDKGKGKSRAVDVEEPKKSAPKSEPTGELFADILRHAMELSKSTPAPRSPDEAGPSGSSRLPPPAKPAVSEREQAQIDRAIALSSVEQVQDTLTKLRTEFVLPTDLDHYTPSSDDRDETASTSSASSSDLAKLIPYTSANKTVYKYENALNGLLEELDKIDSHGDAEVREKRKDVVKAIERALEGVEHVVGEAVEKRLSVNSIAAPATDKPLEGFDVDDDTTEETTPALEREDTPAAVGDIAVPEPVISVQEQETIIAPAEVPSLASDATADLPVEPTSTESDVEASTATITPVSVGATSVPETEPIKSQILAEAPETVDALLLPEKASPVSPVKNPQDIDSDADGELLALDSDAEKSDWSELEH